MEVKEEPPEQFVFILPPPGYDTELPQEDPEEEEEEIDPNCTQANLKDEPPEDASTLPPTMNDQPHSTTNLKRQNVEKYCCTKCGHECKTKYALLAHLSSKNMKKCADCDAKFSCKRLLDRHHREFHGVVLKCNECSYQVENKRLLARHQAIHEKKFACETCHKMFSENHSMKLHQQQHWHGIYATAIEEVFVCDKCDKTFSTLKHQKAHQRQVICAVCGKICKHRHSLIEHRRTHEKVGCSICNKMIPRSTLAYHTRTHVADDIFECDLCDLKAKRKGHLKAHIGRKHRGSEKLPVVKLETSSSCQMLKKNLKSTRCFDTSATDERSVTKGITDWRSSNFVKKPSTVRTVTKLSQIQST